MSENRAPGCVWTMRKLGSPVNGGVRTTDDDKIAILYYGSNGRAQSILLSRGDARLLAKRINQCLDYTVKK